ncbi:glycoside hydrolase family 2 TIM barrel-domain containing protein [Niveibacterium sp. SC-1]|uniref:glycoside hydrolase family 2 protein n=2 Tax=Niveibacterium sp. SC-1 TaxID=3135646 RepID=UPI00311E93B1
MTDSVAWNDSWVFHREFSTDLRQNARAGEGVRLPHNALDTGLDYFDEKSYQKAFCYQKTFELAGVEAGREVYLHFEGAMADTVVWLNGHEVAAHTDGYTPFRARLTDHLRSGTNLVTVKIDGSENPEIPPFGGQIDYLTYAGLYREVRLECPTALWLRLLKVETRDELQDRKAVRVCVTLDNPRQVAVQGEVEAELLDGEGRVLARERVAVHQQHVELSFSGLEGLDLWTQDAPTLYSLRCTLNTPYGKHVAQTRFGFRTAEFRADGFFLNGRKLKLRGLNRHQSYPYVGYAMGRRAQQKDADILKDVLACNIVRTSHYPQSPYFLDRCDEIGLLVFEEIPGWQHIGGEIWKDRSVANVRAMVERDWNHPSIVVWGVRINESADDSAFYARTNRLARELDPSRQTGGVRYIENSELLEDIYTVNDFVHAASDDWLAVRGVAATALRTPRQVTGLDRDVPYLVTEYNGHMFPTKAIDPEVRQQEHVLRHLDVLDAAYGDPAIAGAIGWCMFDYNTHKDFGAGDRICHHGVMDMFREPKFAAFAYQSQRSTSEGPVLEPVTVWARGEKDRCDAFPLVVLTNCDYVEFQFGEFAPVRIEPDRARYRHLPNAPVIIQQHHIAAKDLGSWGMLWREARIHGYVDGIEVKSVLLCADPVPTTLDVSVDDAELRSDEKDATRIVVRACDQTGRKLAFIDEVLSISISGPGRIIGPALRTFKAGSVAFWVETTGAEGVIEVSLSSERFAPRSVHLAASRGARS